MSSDEEATPQGANDASVACPYLGLADDADSHATFATDAHRCFRLPNPTRIASGHQDTYCLSDNHVTCPVYLGEAVSQTRQRGGAATAATDAGPDPGGGPQTPPPGEGVVSPRPRAGGVPMPALTIGILVLAAIVLGLAIWIQGLGGDDDDGLSPSDIVQTQEALETLQAGSPEATDTPENGIDTPTSEPGSTETPATAVAETPTSSGQTTYTVVAGDTCTAIAEKNGITLEELLLANNLDNESCRSIQPGQELVIP